MFVRDWKKAFYTDTKKKVACVPFMRNLIEYTKGEGDADFLQLTSLLHWKPDSAKITIGDLDVIYNRLFSDSGKSPDGTIAVMNLIEGEASNCLKAPDGINFENKVVLSIATRLAAERFMVKKISDDAWVASITANQTPALLQRFKNNFSTETASISALQRVVLMTPENIHLNSFMYEPILDMSDSHLRRLYEDVLSLA